MSLRTAIALLAALAMTGCGSAAHRPRPETRSERVASDCGTLWARLQGTATEQGLRDPQPATLLGRMPAERTAQSSLKAIAVSREVEAALRRAHAPSASLRALERAVAGYASYARSLHGASARSGAAGLHMEFGFMRLGAIEYAGCIDPVRAG